MSGLGNLWRDSAVEQFDAPVLDHETRADLVILGGGFTGCSAALEAAQQGADVVLLEAETVGHGGSGRNVGLVNAGLWLTPDQVCAQLGRGPGRRLNMILSAAPDVVFDLIAQHDIRCDAVRAGTMHLAHAAKGIPGLKTRMAQMAAQGAPVMWLDAEETRMRTGTTAFCAAIHDARAGTLQPLAYACGLARVAQATGARIYQHSPAVEARFENNTWHILTAQGQVTARRLLVATNAYHRPVVRVSIPAVPAVNYFQLATAPMGDNQAADILPGGEGCWDTGLIMTSIRRDMAGRIIIGGMGGGQGAHAGWARRKLARLYPQLAGAKITHAWAGRISMTSDHLPRILRLGPGGLSVFGYSGRGIGPGTIFGQATARALLNEGDDMLPITPVDTYDEALAGLKSAFYEGGAQVVHFLAAR